MLVAGGTGQVGVQLTPTQHSRAVAEALSRAMWAFAMRVKNLREAALSLIFSFCLGFRVCPVFKSELEETARSGWAKVVPTSFH